MMTELPESECEEVTNDLSAVDEEYDKVMVLWSPGDLKSIVLREGFNLHKIPANYLTRKSYIEKLIYHATMSDQLKSPFSGIKLANKFIDEINHIDVIGGVKCIKSFVKSLLKANSRASAMIHRVGNTWLIDEFDVDSFLLAGGQCRDWMWLREFLTKENFRLYIDTRSSLVSQDLESKFLYHTVLQTSELGPRKYVNVPSLPPSNHGVKSANFVTLNRSVSDNMEVVPITGGVQCATSYDSTPDWKPRHSSDTYLDQYLNTAKWRLCDLSFLVGSDLPIFGTPLHPCISLKLSPQHEPISVLTGIDMWLENIINEVPEVAMCYHHEGIVMQEYEIYKTCELPSIVGFDEQQVGRIVRNLIMFLKRNATKEGHTYWLVKEPALGIVKLYDLTTLGYKQMLEKRNEGQYTGDMNPFILPVASLCFKLAEQRANEYKCYINEQLSAPFMNDKNFDANICVTDALRLLKNCLNLITVIERTYSFDGSDNDFADSMCNLNSPKLPSGVSDLKYRSILLLFQLYVITPEDVMSLCFKHLESGVTQGHDALSVAVEQFSSSTGCANLDDAANDRSLTVYDESASSMERKQLGSLIIDAFKSSNTSQLSRLITSLLGSSSHSRLALRTKCSKDLDNPIDNSKQLISPVHQHHQILCLSITLLKANINKSQKLWSVVHKSLNSSGSVPINLLQELIRMTLPALFLLEHLIPDEYTNLLMYSICSPPSNKSPQCPYCLMPGKANAKLTGGTIGLSCLRDALFRYSCLFVAIIILYSDTLTRNAQSMETRSCTITLSANEQLLMKSACENGLTQLPLYIESAIYGPVTSNMPADINDFNRWLSVLSLTASCFVRLFGGYLQSTTSKWKHPTSINYNGPADLGTNNLYINELHINIDWWPVLVNMFVCTLRFMWSQQIADSEDEQLRLHFADLLDKGLELTDISSMMTSLTSIFSELNGQSEFLHHTNKFQLFKLLAVYSQLYPHSHWTNRLVNDTNINSILPSETLYFVKSKKANRHEKCEPTMALPKNGANFSTTSICLANAIEALLQQQRKRKLINSGHTNANLCSTTLLLQFYLDLLNTANEYFAMCLEEVNSMQNNKPVCLDTVNNVLKRILHHLPSELTPSSITDEQCSIVDKDMKRNLLRALVNLRLHQLKVTLYRHQQGVKFGRCRTQNPLWSTMITQTKTTIDWHASHLTGYCKSEPGIDSTTTNIEMDDFVLHITLISHLVSLQLVNQDVLSPKGLQTVLHDLLAVKPILEFIKPLEITGAASMVEVTGPLKSISHSLDQLVTKLADKSRRVGSRLNHKKSTGLREDTTVQRLASQMVLCNPECENDFCDIYNSLQTKLDHLQNYLNRV